MTNSTAWSRADLHMHTVHSDGGATVRELLSHISLNTDLRVIAITDHDTIHGAVEAAQLGPRYGIEVIIGEEISTACGHMLALFIKQHVPAGLSAAETIRRIHAQGGLAIAPHPFDTSVASLGRHMSATELRALPLDGIEVFNAGIFGPWRAANAAARLLADAMQVAQIGCSDAHALCAIGSGRTLFPGRSAADARAAFHARRTRAEGEYLSERAHVRQVFDMMRRLGLRSFAQALRKGAGVRQGNAQPVQSQHAAHTFQPPV